MNEKVFQTLEYTKIRSLLAEHAFSAEAKQRCLELVPSTDLAEIKGLTRQTADALGWILRCGALSFSGTRNLNDLLKRLEIGASLNPAELLRVSFLLEAARRIRSYFRQTREDAPEDTLTELYTQIEPLTPLHEEIKRCILSEEEIADDASPALHSIRRSLHGMTDRIRGQMNKLINDSTTRTYLQDTVITMRDGRYCLPIRSEYKAQVPGMVHDQSSSGSTLFIEPMAVVNLNNEYRELELKEKAEIEKILARLSQSVADNAQAIEINYRALLQLDFIFAKAAYAETYNGVAPVFNTKGRIHIKKGRHPLLDPGKVVPIDIWLGEDFSQLIVTGPNTGGKTVSLKTVGLLTLMGQSGMLIPASEQSVLSVFEEIFADIGDEQSIEQSLSTFSSHMTNIVRIMEQADDRSLVLFDELCAGTDPTEGAALAIAILSRLHLYGAKTMATTHYSELKIYALSTDGVENACCEFNVETLSPTYRLLIGIPGKSNAFAISEKLGLDHSFIEDAKLHINETQESFEDLLADLEQSRTAIEKEQLEIEQTKKEITALKKRLEEKQEKLDAGRDKILREANEEAVRILKDAKDYADETIRNFRKYGASNASFPSASEMERERANIRDRMNAHQSKSGDMPKPETPTHKVPKKLRLGDKVKVISMNMTGTVHTLPNADGVLTVQMGILSSQVNIRDLVLIEEDASPAAKKGGKASSGKTSVSKAATISAEINLIGKTTDEAISLLDKYLDDAYISHLPSVRIVHGKGTGALRKAVWNHLKRCNYVSSYHLGEYGEGDAGVTIATFE